MNTRGRWLIRILVPLAAVIAVLCIVVKSKALALASLHLNLPSSEIGKNLLQPATAYIQNLINLAMASIGATASVTYKFSNEQHLSFWEESLIILIVCTLIGSICFGQLAVGTLLDIYTSSGSMTTIGGPFDYLNRAQVYSLIAATIMFFVLLLSERPDKPVSGS